MYFRPSNLILIQAILPAVIQRIQSVLLFVAFLLNGSIFFNTLYQHAMNDPSGWIGIVFAVVLTIACLLPLLCIFLYANRQNQLRWLNISLVVQLVVLGFGIGFLVSMGGFGSFLLNETIGVALLLAALLTELYARKKVRDDIELVKSMDRIR